MPPEGRPRDTKPLERDLMTEATTRGPGGRKEDWITHQFRRVYDGALEDAVTPEMRRLLDLLDEPQEDPQESDDRNEGSDA